jgi:hypothetical protein
MYADGHPVTMPLSAVLSTMRSVKLALPGALQQVLPLPPAQPLHVDSIAQAIVQIGISTDFDEENNGEARVKTFEVQDLQKLT